MIGQYDPLGHLFKNRIQIIEITRPVDRITVLHESLFRHGITDMHCQRRTCSRLRRRGCTGEVDLHDGLSDLRHKRLRDRILCGALCSP